MYAGTLQADALGLVAAKTRASLMVEGELPEDGLAALDGDGGDVHLALARRLAGSADDGRDEAHSLEALFAEARRGEDQADELLVEGDWDIEPQTPAAPIRFPAPAALGPIDDLPLFAISRAAGPPATASADGKVVTLEELTRRVPPRKPRPRPVADGQLALFGA